MTHRFTSLASLLILVFCNVDRSQHTSCPVRQNEDPPLAVGTCNGNDRTTSPMRDYRLVYNMTGRDALNLIGKVQHRQGDCKRYYADGELHVPLLAIRFESNTTFRLQAEHAVRIANQMSYLFTRGACGSEKQRSVFNITDNEKYIFGVIRSTFEVDDIVVGTGLSFQRNVLSGKEYFAPYVRRLDNQTYFTVWDQGNNMTAEQNEFVEYIHSIVNTRSYWCSTSIYKPRKGPREDSQDVYVTQSLVEYKDGLWGRPYFECKSSKKWLVPYVVPFFGVDYKATGNDVLKFMGVASVDIDLSKVDINQCDPDGTSSFTYKIFAGTHHCHNKTSKCVHIPGKGFSVGSYKCVCRKGYFFPNKGAKNMFFNGTVIEQHFSVNISHNNHNEFRCLPCKKGCQTCVDGSPCVVEADPVIKWTVLGFTVFCILMVIGISIFVWRCRELQVVKSASPLFLMISLFGAGLMYLEAIALFQEPSDEWCTVAPWLQHIGFALMYGSLLLKTWRISLIFKIRSAKRVKVDDFGLLQRLIPIVLLYVVYLVIWTVAKQPSKSEYKTRDNLKATACSEDWWNHSLLIVDILMLFWGIHLCYTVRKAPTKFNESKFISWSIYNMTVCIIFMKLMKTFLFIDLGPNIVYLLEFIRMQLSVTVLIILVFFPKIIRVLKGRGDQAENTSRSRSAGGGSSDGTMHLVQENETLKAEITRLYGQLETMKSAKLEAGNRTYASRSGSISSGLSMRSTSHGPSNNTSTTTLANGWRHGGSQFFSPAAELVSDFV